MIDSLSMANTVSTWFLVGVIWLIQLVVYPSFRNIDPGRFRGAMLHHQKWMARIVILPMLVELVTSLALLALHTDSLIYWYGCMCVATWGFSTLLIQVPQHTAIAVGDLPQSDSNHLTVWNWPRTLAWTAHGILCAFAVAT